MTPVRKTSLILFGLVMFVQDGSSQSLRPGHWSELYLSFLQARGYLWSLSPLARPVSAHDLAQQAARELTSPTLASAVAYERSLNMAKWLSRRFPQTGQAMVALEFDNSYQHDRDSRVFGGVYRLQTGMAVRPWLELYNTMVADTRLDDAPEYVGFRENGFAGYTEQAYLRVEREGVQFKIGRDYLKLGPGRDAALLISNNARPLDQIYFSFNHRFFAYIRLKGIPW